jgi:hypothetical protein
MFLLSASGRCSRLHNQARITAAVFPVPVGAFTSGGNPFSASRRWYPYGLTPVARSKNSSNVVTYSPE